MNGLAVRLNKLDPIEKNVCSGGISKKVKEHVVLAQTFYDNVYTNFEQ